MNYPVTDVYTVRLICRLVNTIVTHATPFISGKMKNPRLTMSIT